MGVFVCWTEGPRGVRGMRVFAIEQDANDYLLFQKESNKHVPNVSYEINELEVE